MYDRAALQSLIASRRAGHSLPAAFYTGQDAHEADLSLIFGRHWIFVATEAEIPEPGDYATVMVGPNSVIVVRDDDDQVRAYHNVCRHRGSRLLHDAHGITGNLVCPYHQWTYDLSGKLIHAELMPNCVGAGTHDLKPVHVRSLAGLVYICLAEQPPADFDDMTREMLPYLSPHKLARAKVAHQVDIVEPGNWKLVIENNRECYHCGGHPELLRSLFHFFGGTSHEIPEHQQGDWERYQSTHRDMVGVWDQTGLPWQVIEKLSGRPTGFRTERLALDGPGESYTMDARRACQRLMGSFTNARLGSLHLHTQPNAWFHFLGDHAVTFSVLPLAADRTLLRTTWLVDREAVEGQDYDVANLTQVWDATNTQDSSFVAWTQAGAGSQGYEPGPYAPSEYMVDAFCTWYLERLGAGLAG